MAKAKENNFKFPHMKLEKTIKRRFLQSIHGQLGMIFLFQFNNLDFYLVKMLLRSLLAVHLILEISKVLNKN
jgi:hypothetical protein